MKFILPIITTCLVSSLAAKSPYYPVSALQEAEHCNHNHLLNPIGLMGAHTHHEGEWMFSYRFMSMQMDKNYDGSNSVSAADVLRDYMVSPTEMQMEMHMIGLMYGVTDRLTVGAMVNYSDLEMSHVTRTGATFDTESEGIGDTVISAFYKLKHTRVSSLHAGMGIVLPTASTDEEDFITPMASVGVLPFPMQLGSGSWGLRPSLTYNGSYRRFSWGGQVMATFNLDDNDSGYRLGNSVTANLWGTLSATEDLSFSLRLQGSGWQNIEGSANNAATPVTTPAGQRTVPTADPHLRGGQRLDLFIGASYLIPHTDLRLAGEVGETIWRDLDGPQLGTGLTVNFGVQTAF